MSKNKEWWRKVLIFSPHSDDESLSLGGTICNIKANGGEVRVVVAVAGDVVFWHNGRVEVPAEKRVEELKGAMGCLDVDSWRVVFKERNLESRLDTIPIRDLIYEFDKEIESYRPSTLFFPRRSYHQDHIIVNRAAIASCRPNLDKFMVPRVIEYEYPSNAWNRYSDESWANFYISISEEYLDRKIHAFQLHASQQRKQEDVLGVTNIRRWSEMRGSAVDCKFAEACRVWRWIECQGGE